jgi:catecholate siderophore receptor
MRFERKTHGKSERKRDKAARRRPKYWVTVGAMGALVAYGAFDSRVLVSAHACGLGDTAPVESVQRRAQGPTHRFDIAAGPLGEVLDAFKDVTGWEVVLKSDEMRNIASPGVAGVFSDEQALQRLLDGTGIAYRFTAADTVTLEVLGPSSSVTVTDDLHQISSPKYTAPLRDIPQTITVIPSEVIEQQGATTLRDVLRNVPGLTLVAGEGGNPAGDNLTLRGFSARNDVFVDGVRDLSPQARDPFNLEQVEVTKGPTSAYTGRGSAGGAINLVSKAPRLNSFYDFTLNFGTDSTKRVAGDINVPLESLGWGSGAAFRMNFVAHQSDVAGRDIVENQRWGVAPSLSFGLGTPTRLTLSYFKLNQDNISDYGIPWVPVTNNVLKEFRDRPAPVPRDTFYGFANRDKEELTSDIATVKLEHDFNDHLSLRNQFRFGHSTRDSIATPPRFASNDSLVINREMRSWLTEDNVWDNQTDLTARFSTGEVRHTLVGGLAFTREENERRTRTAPNETTTLFNPNPYDEPEGEITLSPIVGEVEGKSAAAYLFDTVSFGTHLQLNGGLRFDYFDADGKDLLGAKVSRVDQIVSGRIGVVYKPVENGSIYAAYGSSVSPSLEGLSYGAADSRVDPEETYTFEAGTKWDLFRNRLSATLAGFRVDKTNARTPSLVPGGPTQVLEGRQRVVGAEFGLSGQITAEWSVLAGYTFLDSKILESNSGPNTLPLPTLRDEGNRIQNTPKHSANVWTTYQLPWRVSVGGGLRFVDDRYGNNGNTRKVDSYWTADLTASYGVTEHVDIRVNVFNLNNAYYFDRLGGGHVIPGPARSANVSLGFRF